MYEVATINIKVQLNYYSVVLKQTNRKNSLFNLKVASNIK